MSANRFSVLALTALAVFGLACGGGDTAAPEGEAPAAAESSAPKDVFEVDPATAATVTGKISFEGDAPKPALVNMGADEDCKAMHDGPIYSERLIVNDNQTVKNVFVWVSKGLEGKDFAVPAEKVSIDQNGCIYVPHVVGVMVGQELTVKNSDPTLHNVHPLPRSNPESNRSQAAGAGDIVEIYKKAEPMIPVKCNIHPWMRAYVNVSPHPFFAVTGDDGTFTISGLPPGEYTIEAVHESLGTQEIQITVGAGESAQADFTLKG